MDEEFVDLTDRTRLWTTVSGEGLPIVFLNGGPGMPDYLQPVADLLDEGRHRIYRFEPRGCGRSSRVGAVTLVDSISDIEQLRQHWQVPSWLVVGHSWGADLGLAYAVDHPEAVVGLVGISGGRVHNDRHWHKVYDANTHKEEIPPCAGEPNFDVKREINEEWKVYCRRPQLLSDLSELTVPTVFIWGDNDIRPSWPTQQISELIPDAEFIVLENADHNLWQGNADGLRNELTRFITKQTNVVESRSEP